MNNETSTSKMWVFEISGVFFVFLISLILKNSFVFAPQNIFSVILGAVNNSIWENVKILIIPYILWFGIEVCLSIVPFRVLVVSKTISLYFMMISSILAYRALQYFNVYDNYLIITVVTIALIVISFFLSYKLMFSKLDFSLWNTLSAFMMILVVVMILGFTVNPPEMWIFRDYYRDIYGLCVPVCCIF